MAHWKLSRKEEACTRCERAFEEDEAHYSVLRVTGEELLREDNCPPCFQARREEGGEDLVFWRGRFRVGRKALAVDFEAIEGLFMALEGRREKELRELRYLLCLLLMRKKKVKLVRTTKEPDGEAMVMRRPRRLEEELLVYVFELTGDKAEELRGKLRAIFEGADLEEVLALPAEVAGESGSGDDGSG